MSSSIASYPEKVEAIFDHLDHHDTRKYVKSPLSWDSVFCLLRVTDGAPQAGALTLLAPSYLILF